jgi:hypothetical protein
MVQPREQPAMDPSSFPALVSGLAAQAQIFLGVLQNPLTNQFEKVDLGRTQMLISTLQMLHEKTSGNLQPEEAQFLQTILTDLQMRFVEKQNEAESG